MARLTGEAYVNSDSKRHLDVAAGTLAAAALSPCIGLLAVGSILDTKSSPFIRQERVGKDRNPLRVIKVRTLKKLCEEEEIQTFGTFDPRASVYGAIIRQSGLDEAPQLLNVIKGEMSMVGMRPLIEKDLEHWAGIDPKLFDDWYWWYEKTRPGLTGKSQLYRHGIKEASDSQIAEGMQRDVNYMQRASLLSDVALIARTPPGLIMASLRAHACGIGQQPTGQEAQR